MFTPHRHHPMLIGSNIPCPAGLSIVRFPLQFVPSNWTSPSSSSSSSPTTTTIMFITMYQSIEVFQHPTRNQQIFALVRSSSPHYLHPDPSLVQWLAAACPTFNALARVLQLGYHHHHHRHHHHRHHHPPRALPCPAGCSSAIIIITITVIAIHLDLNLSTRL